MNPIGLMISSTHSPNILPEAQGLRQAIALSWIAKAIGAWNTLAGGKPVMGSCKKYFSNNISGNFSKLLVLLKIVNEHNTMSYWLLKLMPMEGFESVSQSVSQSVSDKVLWQLETTCIIMHADCGL